MGKTTNPDCEILPFSFLPVWKIPPPWSMPTQETPLLRHLSSSCGLSTHHLLGRAPPVPSPAACTGTSTYTAHPPACAEYEHCDVSSGTRPSLDPAA